MPRTKCTLGSAVERSAWLALLLMGACGSPVDDGKTRANATVAAVESRPVPQVPVEEPVASPVPNTHRFALAKGSGTKVCDAYIERLNTTGFFESPPYCGRPENPAIQGFANLRRVQLSVDELYEILDRLIAFTELGDQEGNERYRADLLSVCNKAQLQAICDKRMKDKREAEARGARWKETISKKDLRDFRSIRAWRYEPEVDIDNDSLPDRVLLFHRGRCGSGRDGSRREPTYAFVMNEGYKTIDEQKTREIFGHPQPEWPGVKSPRFRYIGAELGVFQYDGQFYFDTFMTSWTDFDGQRLNEESLAQTLGVFSRKSGATGQICEITYPDPAP